MIPPTVIAEIGCVHLGSMERAKKLIKLATLCEADYVKFQKRNPDESVPENIKNKPHPNKTFAYGETYLEHRKALEFDIEQHKELYSYCKQLGIGYSCSVWDMTSAAQIASLNPDFIKIPSPCNHNREMIKYLLGRFDGDIHISTGMSSKEEKEDLIKFMQSFVIDRFVIYHCTSIYPCPFDKLHLLEIGRLVDSGFRVGFSNHGYGIAADIAAMMLGSEYIERHFVDDRTLRHTDAAASLEPEGLRKLCRDLKNVSCAIDYAPPYPDEKELTERAKLRKEQ